MLSLFIFGLICKRAAQQPRAFAPSQICRVVLETHVNPPSDQHLQRKRHFSVTHQYAAVEVSALEATR